jgi:ABC-type thiamine transport system ATPase subunit
MMIAHHDRTETFSYGSAFLSMLPGFLRAAFSEISHRMTRRSERETPPPPRPAEMLFQHAFALSVDVQERICHAMLALRAVTDVIIHKIDGRGVS